MSWARLMGLCVWLWVWPWALFQCLDTPVHSVPQGGVFIDRHPNSQLLLHLVTIPLCHALLTDTNLALALQWE